MDLIMGATRGSGKRRCRMEPFHAGMAKGSACLAQPGVEKPAISGQSAANSTQKGHSAAGQTSAGPEGCPGWRQGMSISIRDWPERDRPREKLLKTGAASLSEAELVLQAALELTRRHYQELMTVGSALENPQATREFVQFRLRDLPYEVFCCLLLDSHYRVLGFEELFRGTIDGAIVHPREVLRLALSRNAAALILVHNHPSGIAEPSPADRSITVRLRDALALVDIRVLDHLVVGDGVCESFAERGWL